MNTTDLVQKIVKRLIKYWLFILLIGVFVGFTLCFYTINQRTVYTGKATLFPLTNAAENSISSSSLSGLLGLGDAPKSFSSEASINIIELTLSRFVRELMASQKIPEFGNKTITYLLIEDFNAHRSYITKSIKLPADSTSAAILGGELLKPAIVAKMSKNGMLELYFSHDNKTFITPFTFVLIDKVSQFYIDLKIKKATADYNFTVKKIDSLDDVLNSIDKKAIRMQNTTFFTPKLLEYDIPKERINADKQRYVRQRDMSLNNQEEALWRLQKLTPIISILDRPTAPFTEKPPSVFLNTFVGFFIGCLLTAFVLVFNILYHYIKIEIGKRLMLDMPTA